MYPVIFVSEVWGPTDRDANSRPKASAAWAAMCDLPVPAGPTIRTCSPTDSAAMTLAKAGCAPSISTLSSVDSRTTTVVVGNTTLLISSLTIWRTVSGSTEGPERVASKAASAAALSSGIAADTGASFLDSTAWTTAWTGELAAGVSAGMDSGAAGADESEAGLVPRWHSEIDDDGTGAPTLIGRVVALASMR